MLLSNETPYQEYIHMIDTIASALLQARLDGRQIDCAPLPTMENEAYAIQQAIIEASDDTVSGIKIGASNAKTQTILGLNQPFFGPMFSRDTLIFKDTKHDLQAPLVAAYPVKVETEFVIGLKSTLTGSAGDISMSQVMNAIDWIAPGLELIGSRINNLPEKPGLCAIADGGGNHSVIVGKPERSWKTRDWQTQLTALSINGKQVRSGHSGDSIAGSPIGMLHWLLNFDRFAGKQIAAGQFIFCGTCTIPVMLQAGDQLHADFGELGELRVACTG
ncbi:MAG: fumarylacetoacetate hydrolase family protein [Granulosicoccaceae bacterium]